MSYPNEFLQDFRPLYFAILREKQWKPERVELEIIDEEPEGDSIFEPAGAKEVLEQLSCDLNFLTIYTERPAYFLEYTERMYDENGLIVTMFSKAAFCSGRRPRQDMFFPKGFGRIEPLAAGIALVLDFEWEGVGYEEMMHPGRYYIPIHKKPWQMAENLDITIPIGYNTVIVKGIQSTRKKLKRDRFETAFYNS